MATAPHRRQVRKIGYPTSDGKPMAETDIHRKDMIDLILALEVHFAGDPMTYVSGNLLMFYEKGNRRKHVSPDVFVVLGIENKNRLNYLIWEEGKAPDLVIEITSKSTEREDQQKKWELYRDVLRVPEYFLFDPTEDYLKPPLQGFRLVDDEYAPIELSDGRLPSEVLALHLERSGQELRLYDPVRRSRLMKPGERASAAEQRAESAEQQAKAREALVRETQAQNERLREENEALRLRLSSGQ